MENFLIVALVFLLYSAAGGNALEEGSGTQSTSKCWCFDVVTNYLTYYRVIRTLAESEKITIIVISKQNPPKQGKIERGKYLQLVKGCTWHQLKIIPFQTSAWFRKSLFRSHGHI